MSIRTAFEDAEAKLQDFHLHDTCQYFASWFGMRGGRPQAIEQVLGHARLTMTLRCAHRAPDHLHNEVARMERRAESADKITQGRDPQTGRGIPEVVGAEAGTRTPTPLRALDPESSASANSATSARKA
jgi:hypothetical protein